MEKSGKKWIKVDTSGKKWIELTKNGNIEFCKVGEDKLSKYTSIKFNICS